MIEMKKFKSLKVEIEKIISNSPLEEDLHHSKLTLEWLLKLKHDSDEPLQIAALTHDIDRAVTGITEAHHLKDLSKIHEFKREHAIRSAKITIGLLKKYEYDTKTIEKVRHLVEKHEVGGDNETNILMDADSLAYFDYNIYFYFKRNGMKKTKKKIEFMYKRMSVKAKKLAKNMKFRDKDVEELFKETVSGS